MTALAVGFSPVVARCLPNAAHGQRPYQPLSRWPSKYLVRRNLATNAVHVLETQTQWDSCSLHCHNIINLSTAPDQNGTEYGVLLVVRELTCCAATLYPSVLRNGPSFRRCLDSVQRLSDPSDCSYICLADILYTPPLTFPTYDLDIVLLVARAS
jgi:hypothetical protein